MYKFEISKLKRDEIMNNIYFTPKEKIIFLLLLDGIKQKDIPKHINCSLRTVKYKVKNIYNKISIYYENKNEEYYNNYVYMHIFPNGKKYVGCCIDCTMRWQNGNGYKTNIFMYNDILKYGWENIEHIILLKTKDSNIAFQLEKNLIIALHLTDKNFGYNRQ